MSAPGYPRASPVSSPGPPEPDRQEPALAPRTSSVPLGGAWPLRAPLPTVGSERRSSPRPAIRSPPSPSSSESCPQAAARDLTAGVYDAPVDSTNRPHVQVTRSGRRHSHSPARGPVPPEQIERYRQRLSPGDFRERLETRSHAHRGQRHWSVDDKLYLLTHPADLDRSIALALGRSAQAVRDQRSALRRLGVLDLLGTLPPPPP